MKAHELIRLPGEAQTDGVLSFVGGCPNLQGDVPLPTCDFCAAQMTFYFQIGLPEGHEWAGKILSFFGCTSCEPLNFGTPPSPPDVQRPPDGFLDTFQKNFRVMVQDAGDHELRRDLEPRIEFERLVLRPSRKTKVASTHIGGRPVWTWYGDETPVSYQGQPFIFLLQIVDDWNFTKMPEAPEQYCYPFLGDPYPHPGSYEIFSGLPLYFFGVVHEGRYQVYVLNQK